MNISSVIVRSRPEHTERIRSQISSLPGVDVHAATADGRVIATIEDTDTALAADTFVRLHDVQGVVSVVLIYQYSDDSPVEEAQT